MSDGASPACALHLVDPAYSGLDEETLARARWRVRRDARRRALPDPTGAAATRRARTVRLRS